MSESKTMVDQKVSELCEQLKKLSSIQERAQTAKEILEKLEDICNDLHSTGDKQVELIEEKIKSFGEGQIENIRGHLDDFRNTIEGVVSTADESLGNLNRGLEEIKKTPLVEELRGVRENVLTRLDAVKKQTGYWVKTFSRGQSKLYGIGASVLTRLDTVETDVEQLAEALSNAASESLKRDEEHAAETKDGLAGVDTAVKGQARVLSENLQQGLAKQSEELRGVRENVSTRFDTLEGNVKQLAEALSNAASESLKRDEEHAAEIRDGLAGLEDAVTGQMGMLGENFQQWLAKQSEELRGVRESVSTRFDTLEGNVKQLAEALSNVTSEVSKRDEEHATETRDGLVGLDTAVKRILNYFTVMGVLAVLGTLIYVLYRCGIVSLVSNMIS